ncbi:hypothetical protein ACFL0J_08450 [Candidatus Neomarinimicrobiota bacterium]
MSKMAIFEEEKTQPRHEITGKYESNPRHIERSRQTINWLSNFNIKGKCIDLGDRTGMDKLIELKFGVTVENTNHDLDYPFIYKKKYRNVFMFEIIEHLVSPLVCFESIKPNIIRDGVLFISTPIYRPKLMRNKNIHFHEFNFNELEHLIEKAGFKILDKKIINPTKFRYAFTGLRPFIRWLGLDRNILLAIRPL